jgi:hypothetical protein
MFPHFSAISLSPFLVHSVFFSKAILFFDFCFREKQVFGQCCPAILTEFIATAHNWPFAFRALKLCFHSGGEFPAPQSKAAFAWQGKRAQFYHSAPHDSAIPFRTAISAESLMAE